MLCSFRTENETDLVSGYAHVNQNAYGKQCSIIITHRYYQTHKIGGDITIFLLNNHDKGPTIFFGIGGS